MTYPVRIIIVALVAICSSASLLAQTKSDLFTAVISKPADVEITHPASFISLNNAAWYAQDRSLAMGGRVEISLAMPEGDVVVLDVERFRVVEDNTPLYKLSADGITQVRMPASIMLRGKVRGYTTSHVMLALFDSWATGYITLERNGASHRYYLSPLHETPNSIHIVNEDIYSVQPTPWDCATPDTEFPAGGKGGKGVEQTQAVNKVIRVAIEGDVEYYIDHGSDVYKCAQYAQAVVAASSDIYIRDLSAAISTPWMGFWVTTDPYTGTTSSTIQSQFRTYWNTNRTGVDRSSATLLSGVNGIGGIANLDALCTTSGYAVSGTNNNITYPTAAYAWDTDVVCHELGHIVGARHTHSCTWAPPIDSCYTAEGTCFTGTKATVGTIMSYCHLTASGTQLLFHSRVASYMITRLAARTCVLAPGTMQVNAGRDTTICTGVSVTLSGSVNGGTGPYTYFWTPLVGITNPNSLTPTVTPTKDITYALEVRDNAGKISYDSVKVTVGPPLAVTTPSTITACTEGEVSITATASNGVGGYHYTWLYDDVTVHSDSPTLTFSPLFADTIMVFVLATDSRELCDAVDTTMVIVHTKPYVSITGPDTACRGEVIQLNTSMILGTAPYAPAWKINGVPALLSADDVLLTVDSTLNITLVVTDFFGCMDTTEHRVTMLDHKATVTPSTVQLPAIPPCADTASARVVFTNTGTVPITITESNATVVSRPLPRTIGAGGTDTFDVLFTNLPTGSFTRTLEFTENKCDRVFKTTVKGQRNGVRITTPLPLVVGPFIACTDSNAVDYTFSIDNDAGVAVTLSLPEGPIVIPALGDTTIRRTLRGVFTDSTTLDTLVIPYTSGLCAGALSVPLAIRSVQVSLAAPGNVDFGSVFNDVTTPITKSFALTSSSGTVPFVVVDSVDISAPFSTSLRKGQRLNNGVATTASVTLTLSQAQTLGELSDTLRVTFNGCEDTFEIPLNALVVITDISTETSPDGLVSIAERDGSIFIRVTDGSEFTAEVVDIQGRSVWSGSGAANLTVDTKTLGSGAYAVRVVTRKGQTSRVVLISR